MERAGSGGKIFGPSPRKLKLGYTTTPQTPTDGGWCCILASLSGNRLQETLNPKHKIVVVVIDTTDNFGLRKCISAICLHDAARA